MKRLQGKVGIITGAVRGIGRATAERFCEEGASLVIADIDRDGIEKTAAEIRDNGDKPLHDAGCSLWHHAREGLAQFRNGRAGLHRGRCLRPFGSYRCVLRELGYS